LLKLQAEIKPCFDKDEAIPAEERACYAALFKFCKENGAIIKKLKIAYFDPGYRGIMAARDIEAGEIIVYIPDRLCLFSA
jgi:hypothetical protein